MKIVEDMPSGGRIEPPETDAFFDMLPPELFAAVCRGVDAAMHPMALVSGELMVLRQTDACAGLLQEGAFYSLESVLQPSVCDSVRRSIQSRTEHTIAVMLAGQPWQMRIVPTDGGALLVFLRELSHQAGVSMAAARLRESASHLLLQADGLALGGMEEDACVLRREALRILRQANHAQMLSGAPEPMQWELCSTGELLHLAADQLARRGVKVSVQVSEEVSLRADRGLQLSALMTLVSNSLRYGGEKVRIALRADRLEDGDGVVFCVDDSGAGLSDEALMHMNNTWRRPDAEPGGWGLGIPYARRIAELHGGVLVFVHLPDGGCGARLSLPLHPEDGLLGTETDYRMGLASGVSSADIELSDALEADAYRLL